MLTIFLASLISLIHSTDGGVDDFATTALIAAAEQASKDTPQPYELSAVIITNADCEPLSALSGYQKCMQFINHPAQIGLSESRVWMQFPWVWRMESEAVNQLSCLNQNGIKSIASLIEGNALFSKAILAGNQVKIIATGPLTTIADIFKEHPGLDEHVSELHWMGGAIDVPGNIIWSPEIPKYLLNEQAEWNVFADPYAADWVFKNTSFPIYLYPIDISNQTIPKDFTALLETLPQTPATVFVRESYRIVEEQPEYRMWDVVAAAGALFPTVFNPPEVEKLRVETSPTGFGALVRDADGREVIVFKEFKDNDPIYFYEAAARILSGQ